MAVDTEERQTWQTRARRRHRNPILVFLILVVLGGGAVVAALTGSPAEENLGTGPGGSDLTRYLPLPGDQTVVVPDGVYRGGEIAAPHPETRGRYRGWLVLVAESKHGVVVDLTNAPLELGPGTSRILFVGFKFVNGTVTLTGASDVAFWHTDHSFPVEGWAEQLRAAGGDRAALDEIPHYTPTAIRIRPREELVSGIGIYGADIHDVGDDGIIINSVIDSVFQGLRIWNVEERTFDPGFNPNPSIDDFIHNDSIQATGAVSRVHIRDSYLGQVVQWGAQLGSIKDSTFERLWMANSQSVGLINHVFPGHVLTGATREIRAWGNGRFDPALDHFRLDIQGETRVVWPETLSSDQFQMPANLVLDNAPPPGVEMRGRRMVDERQALDHPDNPALLWRERYPYESWRAFFEFPGE